MSIDLLSTLNRNGSGLNLTALAQTLATAETAPRLNALQDRVEQDNLRLSALSQIRAQFDKLGGVLAQTAQNPVLTVTTSSAALMPRVTDRAQLSPDSVPLDVQSLASRQVLEFTGFTSRTTTVEAGRLMVDFGQWTGTDPQDFTPSQGRAPVSLTIPEGTTLDDLATLLSQTTGVTARVLDKGDGTVSLGIVSAMGAQSALRLRAEDATGSGDIALSTLDTGTTNAARQVQAAADARVLVDGIMVSRPDNVIKDILPGLEVTLSAVMSGRLDIGRDRDAAAQNIQSLIGGLNEAFTLMNTLTQRGMGEGEGGDLAGDRMVERVAQDLRRLIAAPLQGFGDRPINLADLGIATQRDGTLRFDPPAFDRNFTLRAADFDALFSDMLRPLTDGLTVGGTPGTQMPAGRFAFATDAQGNATLDGTRLLSLDLGDGVRNHIVPSGPLMGLTLTSDAGITSGTIQFGRSFVASLAQILSDAGAGNGTLGRREAEIDRSTKANSAQIDTLEARAAVLEKRYLTRFAAMEQVVTQMKSTGSYIQNIVDLWSRDR
jgi:flagellar hook-associated protein 2